MTRADIGAGFTFNRAELEILSAALKLMLGQLEIVRLTIDSDDASNIRGTITRTRDLLEWVEGEF